MRIRAGDWMMFTSAERLAILQEVAKKNQQRWEKK
jgi:predicted Fe-S protein YdhL (DUF1289 family)